MRVAYRQVSTINIVGTLLPYLFSSFSIPFIIFALLFSLPPRLNSDPGSHSRLFSQPTHDGSCLAFSIARRFQLFLPSSTRVECAYTRQALSASDPFYIFANLFKISPRRDSNSRTTLLRGIIVIRTFDRHKNLHIPVFLRTVFGPDYCVPL